MVRLNQGWFHDNIYFLLLKVPHVLASAAEDTTLWIVLNFVWMGPFFGGVGFYVHGEGQSLIYKCLAKQFLVSGMMRYAESESTWRTMLMAL